MRGTPAPPGASGHAAPSADPNDSDRGLPPRVGGGESGQASPNPARPPAPPGPVPRRRREGIRPVSQPERLLPSARFSECAMRASSPRVRGVSGARTGTRGVSGARTGARGVRGARLGAAPGWGPARPLRPGASVEGNGGGEAGCPQRGPDGSGHACSNARGVGPDRAGGGPKGTGRPRPRSRADRTYRRRSRHRRRHTHHLAVPAAPGPAARPTCPGPARANWPRTHRTRPLYSVRRRRNSDTAWPSPLSPQVMPTLTCPLEAPFTPQLRRHQPGWVDTRPETPEARQGVGPTIITGWGAYR